jgi:uncharacterized membrane protein YdjX (TVP38/TMEM64 family)
MKIIETFIEIFSWLKIVASPTLLGALAGFLSCKGIAPLYGSWVGVLLALTGLVTGILWANHARKKYGASTFISRVNASPDFDQIKSDE